MHELPIESLAALPQPLSPEARLYLRPTRLCRGPEAEDLVEAGAAMFLAGGPVAFAGLEVLLRSHEVVQRAFAALEAVRRWGAALQPERAAEVAAWLERLGRPRIDPLGGRFDRPLIMGVVNVTPDSFSGGGDPLDHQAVVAFAARLIEEGADMVDVGGESTRPGAVPVATEIELARVMPVLRSLGGRGALVSIDSRRAVVMEAALASGARILNDVSALGDDPRSLEVAARSDAHVVLMHMQGEPATMNLAPAYAHAALDVYDALDERIAACEAAGIPRARIIVDPGLCFGKHEPHNLAILRNLALYHGLGCPILLGASRKGFTEALELGWAPRERLPSSLAAALYALDRGLQIVRVHDVAATHQALLAWRALNLV